MFCTNCGEKILDAAKFCVSCGAPVFSSPAQTDPVSPKPDFAKARKERKKRKRFSVLYGFVCFIVSLSLIGTIVGLVTLFNPAERPGAIASLIVFGIPSVIMIWWLAKNKNRHKEQTIHTLSSNNQPLTRVQNTDVSELQQSARNVLDSISEVQSLIDDNALVAKRNTLLHSSQSHFDLPYRVLSLLWFKNGPYANYVKKRNHSHDIGGITVTFSFDREEPSLIDNRYPITEHNGIPEPLPYYPRYDDMNPRQRYSYLSWLNDITQPIEIGYVFTYYYGLERHLFFGNTSGALQEILELRKWHKNNSFLAYSSDAICLYILISGNGYRDTGLISNSSALGRSLFHVLMTNSLFPDDIIENSTFVGFTNKRYIKANYTMFEDTLKEILRKEFGEEVFPLDKRLLRSYTKSFSIALANTSLSPEERVHRLPDPFSIPSVSNKILSILQETHETVKIRIKETRPKSVKYNEH
ncbi:MAG: TerB N-terminal domain-containing protein [Oscillospiraceae bacterium]|jgi:hypothetical protein|nr:TerB N-terminal domain-containing protein [Oscillospiraceae bacterium]